MSNQNDQFIDDLLAESDDNSNSDLLPFSPNTFDDILSGTSTAHQELADIFTSTLASCDMITRTPSGFSPENNSNLQELTNHVSQAVVLPSNMQSNPTSLEIIAQPYYGKRLRYRSDYEKNESRLGVLKNRNPNSNYQGPAIRIPKEYLNPNGEYFIRVSLVTVQYRGLHYFHPYEIENPLNKQSNNTKNNSVCFPILQEDCHTGIKSFQSIRLVKKTASELKEYRDLHVFDCYDANLQNNVLKQLSNPKDTISEYNLDKSQLVFVVGQKIINNGQVTIHPYSNTAVFSEEMVEGAGKESDGDNDSQSPGENPIVPPPSWRVYKYAPRYGFDTSKEDMVIFLTKKLEPRKHGELSIFFECDTPLGRWSQQVVELDIKDRMVSFKTPTYPNSFDNTIAVDVILRQDNRDIQTIKYYYLSTFDSCSKCQSTAVELPTNVIRNVPNKRTTNMIMGGETQMLTGISFEDDCLVPNSPKFQQSISEPFHESLTSSPSATTSTRASLPSMSLPQTVQDPTEKIIDALTNSIKSLFLNNDYTQLLRMSRTVFKKSPELIHNVIINNNSDVLLKFIPIATIDILQQKNQFGETALLHAIRLNRTEIVKILLENKHLEKLLEDRDAKNNNIFHIIALNLNSSDILDLLINHFLKNSINIQEKFDSVNEDDLTPLQLSIYKNNLLVTKYILKHFNTNVHKTKNLTGDNLIHLAVKHGDLKMVKYLIEEGQLIEQGRQSNLTKTPIELAQSLKREDIIEYFNELYPQPEVEEDHSSDDD